jgi:hypothetical protein
MPGDQAGLARCLGNRLPGERCQLEVEMRPFSVGYQGTM